MKNQTGFTLLELMIVISVAAVLLGIGVPSLQEMSLNNRRAANTNELVSSLNVARSEAVKRNARLVLCASTDGSACSTDTEWEAGWIVFVDDSVENGERDSGEEIVRVTESLPAVTIRSTFSGLTYYPNGRMRTAASDDSAEFIICDGRGTDEANAILIMSSGRPQVSATDLNNNAPSTCTPS